MMEEQKKIPTQRDLNYQQLAELKAKWPQEIFSITRKDDYDYVIMAILFQGFVRIGYKYGNYRYRGFFITFPDDYVPELQDDKFFKTADDAFNALVEWMKDKGYKFRKYDTPKTIDNRFEY